MTSHKSTDNKTHHPSKPLLKLPQKLPQFLSLCSTPLSSIHSLGKTIYKKFKSSYLLNPDYYYVKIINEIICNETSHIVAEFKDYLIYGDYSEFVQNYYTINESKDILPKIYEYYDCCSVIFPNYILLQESKYLYKNIQRKQRVIDNQQEMEQEKEKKKKTKRLQLNLSQSISNVFNSLAFESILNLTDTSAIRKMMGLTSLRNNPPVLQQQGSSNDSASLNNNDNVSLLNLVNVLTKAEASHNKTMKPKINCTLRKPNTNNNKQQTIQTTINTNAKKDTCAQVNSTSVNQSKQTNNNNSNSSPKQNTMLIPKGRNYKRAIYTNDISGLNKMNSTSEKEHIKLYYNTNQVIKATSTINHKMNHTNTTREKPNIDTYTQSEHKNKNNKDNNTPKVNSKHSKHNSHQIKKGLITMLLSTNTETFKKKRSERKVKLQSMIPTHNHCPTSSSVTNKEYYLQHMKTITTLNTLHNKINIPIKPVQLPSSNSKSKSARPNSQSKSNHSMTKLTNKILGVISKINNKQVVDKKPHTNTNTNTIHNNGTKKENSNTVTHNYNTISNTKSTYPLTSREEQKIKFNQKIPTNNNINNHFTATSSTSISHKKTFTSSSLGTATGSLNNNNNYQQTIEDKTKEAINTATIPSAHNHKSSFKPITHRNDRANQTNLRLSNDLFTKTTNNALSTKSNVNLTIKSPRNQFLDNPNNKILKTYSHFQSNSTLIGSKSKNLKPKKQQNDIITINKNDNAQTPRCVKGIKIKGFDEIIENTKDTVGINKTIKTNNVNNSDRNEKKNVPSIGTNKSPSFKKQKTTNIQPKPKTNRFINFSKNS